MPTPAPPDPAPPATAAKSTAPAAVCDAETVAQRLAAVSNAVGSVRLAGLEPDAATVADMERVARGQRTFQAARAALFARIAAERRAAERESR